MKRPSTRPNQITPPPGFVDAIGRDFLAKEAEELPEEGDDKSADDASEE